MRDFTLDIYETVLNSFENKGYVFSTFEEYVLNHKNKVVILKHDVDKLPKNALRMANLEKKFGIKTSYYFRIVKESYDEGIIKQIADLGHEVGYHYENLSEISKEKRVTSKEELYELAIDDFRLNLEKLRKLYPVKTICMHGSPLSKWDNRDLWKKYNYRDYGIIADPYLDVDFDEVFYLTDTGRRWDGDSVSVRDKISGQLSKQRDESLSPGMNRMDRMIPAGLDGKDKGDEWMDPFGGMNRMAGWGKKGFGDLKFRSTWDIIKAAETGLLPDKIMVNVHPQRWDDRFGPWVRELVWQNFKNVIKRHFYVRK